MTIFLCTWGVYSGNTDKAPLVLQVTNQQKNQVYFYLQEPKKKDDQVKYDHEIWYQNQSGIKIIMLSEIHGENKGKKWVLASIYDMNKKTPAVFARYDHQGDKPPEYPTQENDSATWEKGTNNTESRYEVKSYIPAIANIKSSEELKIYMNFIVANNQQVLHEIDAYVKTKLFKKEFESLCRKYSTINVLLKVTTTKKDFDKELLELKKIWISNEVNLQAFYQQEEVDKITKIFDTRIYWITGITIVLIIIIICIIFCIIYPNQVTTTDDMMNNEDDIYDEENPAPTPQLSNSDVSDSETECPITPVIFRTVSETVSFQNIFSSEEMFDDPSRSTEENTNSLQSAEEKVSNEIVTQQEIDTDSLFLSEEIFNTDTNENTDSIKSVEKTVTTKEATITITKKEKKKKKKNIQ